ncbi:MAG: M4 family metallopeptidase [Clostridiales bacterium]|nr:M4 family metallopeptidase [Clostridiales bacterium]
MKCPNCRTEQPETAKFCGKCGFKLEGRVCPKCGTLAPKGAQYCGVCGRKLKKSSGGGHRIWKVALAIVLCLVLVVGTGFIVWEHWQSNAGEESAYDNLLILTDKFTDRAVTDEDSAILAAQDAAESLGLQNAMEELEPLSTAEAYGDSYYRLQQYYRGYPVYGRAVVVLADENGEAFTLVGNVADVDADLNFTPSVTQTELEKSLSAYAEEELELSGEVSLEEASDDALVIYDLYDEETHLAYELSASLDEELYTVVLDANDGEVLVACETLSSASITGTNSSGTVTVNASVSDENEGTYFLYDSERKISILDLDGTTSQKTVGWSGNGRGGDSSDAEDSTKAILGEQVSSTETNSEGAAIFSDDAINYLDTLSKIYDTYENWGINSLYTIYANYRDGFDSGMNAVGGVVTVDGTTFGYISAGLVTGTSDIDAYAHEYAHYIMYSHITLTSNYRSAIAEGFADIYGCLVECEIEGWDEPDWSITGDNINVYRDMAEPTASGNAEYWDGEEDSEHEYNESTIISHAAYLMWRGKDSKIGIGQTYGSLSVDELAELWYRAMLMFPTDCDYNHVCQLVELAAEHMSLSDQQKECISWAFYQVGIAETYTLDADFNLTLYDTNGDSYAEYYASVEVILSEETLSENTAIVYEPGVDGILSFHLDSGKAYKVTLIDNQDDTKKFLFYAYITDKNGYDTLTLYTDFGTVKTGTLSGTIVSASDSSTAIGGASVTVLDGDTVVEELTTDEDGAFEAEVSPGTYTVQIEMDGYDAVELTVSVDLREDVDVGEITMTSSSNEKVLRAKLNELIETYGIFASGQSGTVSNYVVPSWLNPTGILSATILDLDADGSLELQVCRTEKWEYGGYTYYKVLMEVYEADTQAAYLATYMWFDPYGTSADVYDDTYVYPLTYVSLTETENNQILATVNAAQTENGYYLVCEYYMQGVLGDGGYGATWVLEYQNETLQYVCSLENGDVGSSVDTGFAYEEFDNEDPAPFPTKITMYYEPEVTDLKQYYYYTDLEEWDWTPGAIKREFFAKYGLKFASTETEFVFSYDNFGGYGDYYGFSGTTSGDADTELEFRLVINTTASDYESGTFTFEEKLTRGNSLLDSHGDGEAEGDSEAETSGNADVSEIVLDTSYANDYEFGNICAYDSDGNLVWSYETGSYPATELGAISEIGLRDGCYYFVESGTVVAMDAATGEILWRNSDFGGSGASAFAEDCICLAGYYGPDFYAVSYDGTTLCTINSFGTEYYWASNVTISGNTALVSLNDGYYEARINLETWEYTISDVG